LPWLKLLHIGAVVLWCGPLLYLVLALAGPGDDERLTQRRVLRLLYTSVATPAALLAIGSGTLIFLWHGLIAPWLLAKLAVVAGIVLMHAGVGLLVLRSERAEAPVRCRGCTALLGALLAGMSATAWLVLSKPAP